MRLWIDIHNLPQVHFFAGLVPELRQRFTDVTITAHPQQDIFDLAAVKGLPIANEPRQARNFKAGYMAKAITHLATAPRFDAVVTFENVSPALTARARRKPSLCIVDNDLKFRVGGAAQKAENRLKLLFDTILVPECAREAFAAHVPEHKLATFPGLKEDISLAGFAPDATVLDGLPWRDYVIVRPESSRSEYVEGHDPFTGLLLNALVDDGRNVIYLPRDQAQRQSAPASPQVFIPPRQLDGLSLIHFSQATLTGSGTMAREAAVLGIPAVSFFPNRELLAVDDWLKREGRVNWTRDVAEALRYLRSHRPAPVQAPATAGTVATVIAAHLGASV